MRLTGRIGIGAPARDVWAFILDPARLASCVPGIGSVRPVDERTFDGSIQASVGPMHGDFAFRSVIERSEFPSDLLVSIEGRDSVTRSLVRIGVTAALAEAGDGTTEMEYAMTLDVEGRLAILGEMILRAAAGAMIGQVSGCIRARLEGEAAATGGVVAQ